MEQSIWPAFLHGNQQFAYSRLSRLALPWTHLPLTDKKGHFGIVDPEFLLISEADNSYVFKCCSPGEKASPSAPPGFLVRAPKVKMTKDISKRNIT